MIEYGIAAVVGSAVFIIGLIHTF
jgi:hypothetical protein